MKKKWETGNAPIPSPWIAQVSRDDETGIAYISGLIADETGTGVAAETRVILDNLKRIVEDMGLTMDHVIKTNIFMEDLKEFDEMNGVYRNYFSEDNPPARQCVGAGIWGDYRIEISAVVTLK